MIKYLYFTLCLSILGIVAYLIVVLVKQSEVLVNCGYYQQISDLYSRQNLAICGILFIVTIFNAIAYFQIVRVVQNYFKETLQAERRQLTIVFSVFFSVVTIVMIVSFTFGIWDKIVKQVTLRRFFANLFSVFSDFPCILVVLCFHHINYRPSKLIDEITPQLLSPDPKGATELTFSNIEPAT